MSYTCIQRASLQDSEIIPIKSTKDPSSGRRCIQGWSHTKKRQAFGEKHQHQPLDSEDKHRLYSRKISYNDNNNNQHHHHNDHPGPGLTEEWPIHPIHLIRSGNFTPNSDPANLTPIRKGIYNRLVGVSPRWFSLAKMKVRFLVPWWTDHAFGGCPWEKVRLLWKTGFMSV